MKLEKKLKKPSTKRQWVISSLTVFLTVVVLVFFAVMIKAYIDKDFDSVESLQALIARFGFWGPIILTVFQFVQVILPIVPGFLGCCVGSILFGPIVGFLCNYIGIGLGSIVAFFLARKYGKPLLDDLFPQGRYHKWAEWASRSKSYTAFLFVAMILPMFPDDFFCYFTGLSTMKPSKFIWIVALGKPWCILAYSYGFSLIK